VNSFHVERPAVNVGAILTLSTLIPPLVEL